MSESGGWDVNSTPTTNEDGTTTATMQVQPSSRLRTFASDAVNITVRGRIGSDIDYKQLPSGTKVARCRLAVTRRGRDDAGNWHDASTAWYTVKMWGQLGENASVSLFKGQPVVVTGKFEVNEWSNSETGNRGTELVITATTVGHDLGYGVTEYKRIKKEGYRTAMENDGGNPFSTGGGGQFGAGGDGNPMGGERTGNPFGGEGDNSLDAGENDDPLGVGQKETALA
ncbi:MAG TPA: single-stranded DNA-binding protein [Actinomyces sp.]|jgi:single-strand DNA-binding protein|nr:single-stranded DNA-binding protein [Acidobacteriota bacterium]HHT41309.1 single-stranded DNA-binding protein [Actinomyces sp.]